MDRRCACRDIGLSIHLRAIDARHGESAVWLWDPAVCRAIFEIFLDKGRIRLQLVGQREHIGSDAGRAGIEIVASADDTIALQLHRAEAASGAGGQRSLMY